MLSTVIKNYILNTRTFALFISLKCEHFYREALSSCTIYKVHKKKTKVQMRSHDISLCNENFIFLSGKEWKDFNVKQNHFDRLAKPKKKRIFQSTHSILKNTTPQYNIEGVL